jgi:hypothetical protein
MSLPEGITAPYDHVITYEGTYFPISWCDVQHHDDCCCTLKLDFRLSTESLEFMLDVFEENSCIQWLNISNRMIFDRQSKENVVINRIIGLRYFERLNYIGFISEENLALLFTATNYLQLGINVFNFNDSHRIIVVDNIANTKLECIYIQNEFNQYIRPFIAELWKNYNILDLGLTDQEYFYMLDIDVCILTKSGAIINAIIDENNMLHDVKTHEFKLGQIFLDTYNSTADDQDHMIQILSRVNYHKFIKAFVFDYATQIKMDRMLEIIFRLKNDNYVIRPEPFDPTNLNPWYLARRHEEATLEGQFYATVDFNPEDFEDDFLPYRRRHR